VLDHNQAVGGQGNSGSGAVPLVGTALGRAADTGFDNTTVTNSILSHNDALGDDNNSGTASVAGLVGAGVGAGIANFLGGTTSVMGSELDHGQSREYFIRRFRRIYPPYWAAIAIMAIVGVVFFLADIPDLFTSTPYPIPLPWSLNGWQWFGNLTLTETWRFHFHRILGSELAWFSGVAWTLCYEEQFYAVVGMVLLFCPRRFFSAVVVITGATWAAQMAGSRVAGFFFDGYWTTFAAGVLVYWQRNYAAQGGIVVGWAALAAGSVWFGSASPHLLSIHSNPNESACVGLAFALGLSLLQSWDRHLVAFPAARPFFWCGAMCYSLYLVHWPVCKVVEYSFYRFGLRSDAAVLLATVPTCFAISLLAAYAFHVVIERRFLTRPAERSYVGAVSRNANSR
jgi:peptidoglycan/LPS O-acetylase OafA/YrhL